MYMYQAMCFVLHNLFYCNQADFLHDCIIYKTSRMECSLGLSME